MKMSSYPQVIKIQSWIKVFNFTTTKKITFNIQFSLLKHSLNWRLLQLNFGINSVPLSFL